MLLYALLALLPLLTLAYPAPSSAPNASTPSTSAHWVISDFEALIGPNDEWAVFTFQDTDPKNAITLECFLETPIYRSSYGACGDKRDLLFKLSEDEIVLRRTYTVGTGQRITGTATQGTYWKDGEDGNMTSIEGDKVYERLEDWFFPISSIVG